MNRTMNSFLVTGSESGLGRAIADRLEEHGKVVYRYDLVTGGDVRKKPQLPEGAMIDCLVNCAGVNFIGWLEDFSEADWDSVMDVNAKGIFLMTKALLPHLIESEGTVLNIVSNAAHMPMTCSAAYNASKGAALILTKQLARELTRKHNITVFSVSPNKLSETGMSKMIDHQVCETRGWTMEEAQAYQLAGLLTGEETPVHNVAEFIVWLLLEKERHKYLTGCDIPYGV